MDFEIPGQQYAKENGVWDQVVSGCLGCAGFAALLFTIWLVGTVVSVVVATATGAEEPFFVGLTWGSTLGMVVGIVLVSVVGAFAGAVTDKSASSP